MGVKPRSNDGCSIVAAIILIAQITILTISSVLQLISYQYSPCVINIAFIILAVLTLFALHRHNSALIAVYIFLQPLFIAWNVFLLLLYLQIGPLKFPLAETNNSSSVRSFDSLEGSGPEFGSGALVSDDEDLRGSHTVYVPADEPWKVYLGILTLYKSDKQSYMLAHPKLQQTVLSSNNWFEEVTLGRLLEIVQLLVTILLCASGFLVAIFAYKKAKRVETQIVKTDADFRYQSNFTAVNGHSNMASYDRLLQADSCDRILQSHPSFQRSHKLNMSSSYSTRNRYQNHSQY